MTWQVSLQESLTKEPLEDIIDEDGVIGLIEREKNNEQKFKWWQVFDISDQRDVDAVQWAKHLEKKIAIILIAKISWNQD